MTDAPSGWVVLFCRLLMVFFLRLFRLRYNLTANLVRPNYKTTIDNDKKAGNGEIISLNSLKTTTIVRDNDEKAGNGRNNQLEKFFKNYYNKLLFMT